MKNKEYYLVDSKEKFSAVLKYLSDFVGYVAIDTECNSPIALTAKLLGVSLSLTSGEAFYIHYATFDGESYSKVDYFEQIKEGLSSILSSTKKQLIMFNSCYDVIVLRRNLNLDLLSFLHADVILMKHLLEESPPHRLKDTAVKYLGEAWTDDQASLKESVLKNGGRWTVVEKDMYKADLEVLSHYACADADMTLRLFLLFESMLKEQNLVNFFYREESMPLNSVVVGMHEKGLKVDLEYYKNLKEELTKESENLENSIYVSLQTDFSKMYSEIESEILEKHFPLKSGGVLFEKLYSNAGFAIVYNKSDKPTFTKKVIESVFADNPNSSLLKWRLGLISDQEFLKLSQADVNQARRDLFLEVKNTKYVLNILSNDQLGDILFNRLKEKATKTTPKGKNKVDDDVLQSFSSKYTFVDLVLQLRKNNKILSTYVEAAISQNINGIIHPSWLQFGTTSGRFSSREPNYQNLPRKDERVKKGIIARDGKVLVGADYSQLEPRCFANCSNEPSLINAYCNGEDLYGVIAKKIFNLKCTSNEVKDLYPDFRQITKCVALAVTYGAKEWKIAKILNKTPQEAKKIILDYFNKFPELERYILSCHGTVLKTGRVISETGRIRHLDNIFKVKNSTDRVDINIYRNLLNLSVNFPIQSLAASIVNRAMIAINASFKKEKLDAYILMQVHDEIVVECSEDISDTVAEIVKYCMETTYKLKLPLVAEPKVGKTLLDTK